MRVQTAAERQRRKYEGRWDSGIYFGLVPANQHVVGLNGRCVQSKLHENVTAILSSDPELVKSIVRTFWDPTHGREARVLDYEPLTATEPSVPGRITKVPIHQ